MFVLVSKDVLVTYQRVVPGDRALLNARTSERDFRAAGVLQLAAASDDPEASGRCGEHPHVTHTWPGVKLHGLVEEQAADVPVEGQVNQGGEADCSPKLVGLFTRPHRMMVAARGVAK